MRNLQTRARVPKSAQPMVATLVRPIFAQPDAASVWAQHARVVEQLTERFPDAAAMLADAAPDVLAFTGFPKEHWRQIWSNNPLLQRLNKELRCRTDLVGIFPNRDAVIRLVGAVLAEQHDEWAVLRRYTSAESLTKARLRLIDGDAEGTGHWSSSRSPPSLSLRAADRGKEFPGSAMREWIKRSWAAAPNRDE